MWRSSGDALVTGGLGARASYQAKQLDSEVHEVMADTLSWILSHDAAGFIGDGLCMAAATCVAVSAW